MTCRYNIGDVVKLGGNAIYYENKYGVIIDVSEAYKSTNGAVYYKLSVQGRSYTIWLLEEEIAEKIE